MIELYEKFNSLNRSLRDTQYPVAISGAIKAYYGVSKDGFYRISFLSSTNIGLKGVTKAIEIVQGASSETTYWTCFDLKNDDLLSVFCSFGEDMVSCIATEKNETEAASKLRLRYKTWNALFKKTRIPLSEEKAKGLFGELYFMKNFLSKKYNFSEAISAWSGPEQYSKDFAINDTWFEIKTISVHSPVAKISSLQQLSSNVDGHLIVIRVEEMAETFKGADTSINSIIQNILTSLPDNEDRDSFLEKIGKYGFDFSDDIGNKKYSVKKIEKYLVNDTFPILRENDIGSDAINNVSYEIILKLVKKWMEE